jgi:hypothetical protein
MKELKVVANPYCAVDATGVPQGVAGLPGSLDAYIGARLDAVASRLTGKRRFYFPANKDGGLKVVTIQVDSTDTLATVVRAIQCGAVIAADEASAALASVKDFMPPEKALVRERERAQAAYRAYHGKGAKLDDPPTEPTEEPKDESGEPAKPSRDPNQLTSTIRLTTES